MNKLTITMLSKGTWDGVIKKLKIDFHIHEEDPGFYLDVFDSAAKKSEDPQLESTLFNSFSLFSKFIIE